MMMRTWMMVVSAVGFLALGAACVVETTDGTGGTGGTGGTSSSSSSGSSSSGGGTGGGSSATCVKTCGEATGVAADVFTVEICKDAPQVEIDTWAAVVKCTCGTVADPAAGSCSNVCLKDWAPDPAKPDTVVPNTCAGGQPSPECVSCIGSEMAPSCKAEYALCD